MDLSIVSSLYRSAPYLKDFHRRTSAAAQRLGISYEIILVNDGSPDESLEIALELQRIDPRLCVVDLSRNFGHHKALMTGLAHSRGRRVFLLDTDLEEDPELLPLFAETMDRSGYARGTLATREGLSAPVTVRFDEYGVLHLDCQTDADCAAANGVAYHGPGGSGVRAPNMGSPPADESGPAG